MLHRHRTPPVGLSRRGVIVPFSPPPHTIIIIDIVIVCP